MYVSNDIAERIKIIAKQRQVSVKQVLSETGLGRNTMSNLKTSFPQSDSIAKIADYLGCSTDYLLGRTDDPQGTSSNIDPDTAEAIKLFASLPGDKRKELLNFIRAFSK